MIKLDVREYKGFRTEFFITPKVKEFLEEKNIDIKSIIPNNWYLYEADLFDYTDEILDKNFKIVYFGIVEKVNKDLTEKGFEEKFNYEEADDLNPKGIALLKIPANPPFAIKYKKLIDRKKNVRN